MKTISFSSICVPIGCSLSPLSLPLLGSTAVRFSPTASYLSSNCEFSVTGCSALHIGQLQVPGPIRNGSVKDVVLDCDYEATKADVGIVIKWFLKQLADPKADPKAEPTLVYQWIPGRIPQVKAGQVGCRLGGLCAGAIQRKTLASLC